VACLVHKESPENLASAALLAQLDLKDHKDNEACPVPRDCPDLMDRQALKASKTSYCFNILFPLT
jgi:hypothetical protein